MKASTGNLDRFTEIATYAQIMYFLIKVQFVIMRIKYSEGRFDTAFIISSCHLKRTWTRYL